MMGKRKHRNFTPEFKAEAVKQVLDEGRSVSEVARVLGLWPNSLNGWVERAKIDRGDGDPSALTTEERSELAALRREVKTLRVEREILKKAAAFFAKESK